MEPFYFKYIWRKKIGSNLKVSIKPPDGKGMTFKPIVLKFEENKEFRWKGKLLVKGIFDGEHYFIVSKDGDNNTKFIHGEKFSGILVSLFGKMLDKTKDGFELMNKSLKSECEKEDDKERNWKEIPYKKNYTKEEIEESMRLSEKLYGDKDGSVKKN